MDDKITLYYQNCRGLRTKLNTLLMNALADSYDIIILSETWLIPTILDCEILDSRYSIFRCDRNRAATGKRDGGGVLVAVRRGHLQVERCFLLSTPDDNSASIEYVY